MGRIADRSHSFNRGDEVTYVFDVEQSDITLFDAKIVSLMTLLSQYRSFKPCIGHTRWLLDQINDNNKEKYSCIYVYKTQTISRATFLHQ